MRIDTNMCHKLSPQVFIFYVQCFLQEITILQNLNVYDRNEIKLNDALAMNYQVCLLHQPLVMKMMMDPELWGNDD